MDFYLERKFSDFIVACEVDLCNEKNESSYSTILCNIASAEYELEMYRKCIKTCNRVFKLDPNYLQAHLLHLKALVKLGKDEQCRTICENIFDRLKNSYISESISVILDIKNVMDSVKMRLGVFSTVNGSNSEVVSNSVISNSEMISNSEVSPINASAKSISVNREISTTAATSTDKNSSNTSLVDQNTTAQKNNQKNENNEKNEKIPKNENNEKNEKDQNIHNNSSDLCSISCMIGTNDLKSHSATESSAKNSLQCIMEGKNSDIMQSMFSNVNISENSVEDDYQVFTINKEKIVITSDAAENIPKNEIIPNANATEKIPIPIAVTTSSKKKNKRRPSSSPPPCPPSPPLQPSEETEKIDQPEKNNKNEKNEKVGVIVPEQKTEKIEKSEKIDKDGSFEQKTNRPVKSGAKSKKSISITTVEQQQLQQQLLAQPVIGQTGKGTNSPIKGAINSTSSSATAFSPSVQSNGQGDKNDKGDKNKNQAKDTKDAKSQSQPLKGPATSTTTSLSTELKGEKGSEDEAKMTKKFLENFLASCLVNEDALVTRTLLKSVRPSLCCANGEDIVDDMIAFGYLQVNTGKLERAIDIFNTLLQYRSDLSAAHLGIGSAYALTGKFDEAIVSFSKAIQCDPAVGDFWKRRGQTRVALGQIKEGLKDLSKALTLSTDPDIRYQRGLIYYQMKNYRKSLFDFNQALNSGQFFQKPPLYNYIGMCEGQIGNTGASLKAHKKALEFDLKFKEAKLNYAQIHKDLGNVDIADAAFLEAIAMDTTGYWAQGHVYRAQLLHAVGRPREAIEELLKATAKLRDAPPKAPSPVNKPPGETDGSVAGPAGELAMTSLLAICYQSCGDFRTAVSHFSKALVVDQNSCCWYQREVALFIWIRLDKDLRTFCLDDEIDPRIKDGWCKKATWRNILPLPATPTAPAVERYVPLVSPKATPSFEDLSPAISDMNGGPLRNSNNTSDDTLYIDTTSKAHTGHGQQTPHTESPAQLLLRVTSPFGSWLQLRCKGFLPNQRQHKMFGLAILQMSQSVRTHVSSVRLGGPGLQIPDASSSGGASPQSVKNLKTLGNNNAMIKSQNSGRNGSSSTGSSSSGSGGSGSSSSGSSSSSSGRPIPDSSSSSHNNTTISNSNSGSGGQLHPDKSVPSRISSSSSGGPSTGKRQNDLEHTFSWRDFFDIIVKWRQISEPNDPVWWIDRLPLKAFTEGYSLQTPLVNGQLRTTRYYSYYPMAVKQLKKHLKKGYFNANNVYETLPQEKIDKIQLMDGLEEILKFIGKDFYVILRCPSLKNKGTFFEGTRLTLVDHPPEGYEFTIRTPGFPGRCRQYELELDYCFHRLVDALALVNENSGNNENNANNVSSGSNNSDGSSTGGSKGGVNGDSGMGSSSDPRSTSDSSSGSDPSPLKDGGDGGDEEDDSPSDQPSSSSLSSSSSSSFSSAPRSSSSLSSSSSIPSSSSSSTPFPNSSSSSSSSSKSASSPSSSSSSAPPTSSSSSSGNRSSSSSSTSTKSENKVTTQPAHSPTPPTPSHTPHTPSTSSIQPSTNKDHKEILKLSLELYYFWVNFAPLTRGTAACGYASLLSAMLSCGACFLLPLPDNIQLDWEAIFSVDCHDFVDRITPLLPLGVSPLRGDIPSVDSVITTFREMISVLL